MQLTFPAVALHHPLLELSQRQDGQDLTDVSMYVVTQRLIQGLYHGGMPLGTANRRLDIQKCMLNILSSFLC